MFKKLTIDEKFALIVLPIINGIAYATSRYFSEDFDFISSLINPGEVRVAIFLSFMIWFIFTKGFNESISKIGFYMSIFVLISCLYSPDFMYSFKPAIKFFLWINSFALGYFYITDSYRLSLFLKSYIFAYLLQLPSLVFANIFDIGYGIYSYNEIRSGVGGVALAIHLVHYLFFYFLIKNVISEKKWTLLANVLLVFSIFFILISAKRGALIGFILGALVFIILSPKKSQIIKSALPLIIIFSIIFIQFEQSIDSIYFGRQDRYQIQYIENLEKEGRYQEIFQTYDALVKSTKSLIIGNGFFSLGIDNPRGLEYGRQNHVDYLGVLYGMGLTGIFLFLIFHIKIFISFYKYFKKPLSLNTRIIIVLMISSLTHIMISALSSTITGIENRYYVFFLYGGMLKLLFSRKLN